MDTNSEVLIDPSALPQTELDLSIDFDALFKNISAEEYYTNNEIEPLDSSPLSMSPYNHFTPALQDINGLDYLPQIDPVEFMQPQLETAPHSPLQNLTPQKRQSKRTSTRNTEKKARTQSTVVKVKQEPGVSHSQSSSQQDVKLVGVKKERDDKYKKRLAANKKSAQASRERKKVLKDELELKVEELEAENSELATAITEMETENKVLKREFISLQKLINESVVLSKLMAQVNFQPPVDTTVTTQTPSSPLQSVPSTPQTSAPNTPLASQAQLNRLNLAGPLPFPPLPTGANSEAARAAYLMIVLYSFSQYFANTPGFSVNSLLQALPQAKVM